MGNERGRETHAGEAALLNGEDRALAHDERGAAYVEYITLVILVGVIAAAALITVGVPLLNDFQLTQTILGAPVP